MKKIEEIQFEVSSKSGQLKRFLQKPPSQRMPFEIIEVVQILKKVTTFQRYFNTRSDTHQFAVLPTWTTLKSFSHLQDIYTQGSEVVEIYVLLDGKATVAKHSIEYTFSSGMTFGEVEILFQSPARESRAWCSSPEGCNCLVIDRQSLFSTINPDRNIKEPYNYFSRQSYFEELGQFDRKMIASKTDQSKFAAGEYIVKEGAALDKVCWVIRGSVVVTRSMELLQRGSLRPVIFQMDTLEESDTLGEYYSLNKEVMDASYRFENVGSCYSLNLVELLRVAPALQPIFRRNAKKYPTNEQVLEIYELEAEQTNKKNHTLLELHNTPQIRNRYEQSRNQLTRSGSFRMPVASLPSELIIKKTSCDRP